MRLSLSSLYPVLDAGMLPAAAGRDALLRRIVEELIEGGVTVLQYRNKQGSDAEILGDCGVLRAAVSGVGAVKGCSLILNDRADLVAAAGFDGVHVGQLDMSPAEARAIIGANRILGLSTHNEEQVREADRMSADYVAIGPIFATTTKENPDPVVGLDGLRRARALTGKPLVAIGGITLANCRSVREAGADSVAVVSGLFGGLSVNSSGRRVEDSVHQLQKRARDFFTELR